jgi:hypothetical protein
MVPAMKKPCRRALHRSACYKETGCLQVREGDFTALWKCLLGITLGVL